MFLVRRSVRLKADATHGGSVFSATSHAYVASGFSRTRTSNPERGTRNTEPNLNTNREVRSSEV